MSDDALQGSGSYIYVHARTIALNWWALTILSCYPCYFSEPVVKRSRRVHAVLRRPRRYMPTQDDLVRLSNPISRDPIPKYSDPCGTRHAGIAARFRFVIPHGSPTMLRGRMLLSCPFPHSCISTTWLPDHLNECASYPGRQSIPRTPFQPSGLLDDHNTSI